jgi:cytochrome P450
MKLDDINLHDLDLFVNGDPHQAFSLLRREAPVYWHEREGHRGFWAVTRYQDALQVYHDPHTYSSEFGISLTFDNVMPEQVYTARLEGIRTRGATYLQRNSRRSYSAG